ncbi:imidazole glycerol phosphate synthase subunit HisH [Daejeonella sp. H1SJ63]|uniref:imidazole glycerol phosphate synthase subunit HisH n=1 Tax=Daejeonella sp. H1SJ63 TaxID=3034145 RepID=UPI0023ECBD0A|nr:imidazole glycerol phosphate synthase subunit HisH [Daejeonella sp. H1SJ63]
MIVIIDYGVGNIRAFTNIYKQLDIPIKIVQKVEELQGVSKIILPGVGAFDYAMERLEKSGMRRRLDELALIDKVPILGICVGMQMLARSSEEGVLSGLGWLDGVVKKFDTSTIKQTTQLPHMGWNDVYSTKGSSLFEGLQDGARFYFLHSYYFECDNPEDSIATAQYGVDFTCAVNHENIYGIQCHPEKSHSYGIQVLRNFAELKC